VSYCKTRWRVCLCEQVLLKYTEITTKYQRHAIKTASHCSTYHLKSITTTISSTTARYYCQQYDYCCYYYYSLTTATATIHGKRETLDHATYEIGERCSEHVQNWLPSQPLKQTRNCWCLLRKNKLSEKLTGTSEKRATDTTVAAKSTLAEQALCLSEVGLCLTLHSKLEQRQRLLERVHVAVIESSRLQCCYLIL
jgi:hypothetical protein